MWEIDRSFFERSLSLHYYGVPTCKRIWHVLPHEIILTYPTESLGHLKNLQYLLYVFFPPKSSSGLQKVVSILEYFWFLK